MRFFKNYALFLHDRALPLVAAVTAVVGIYFICQLFFEPVIQDAVMKKTSESAAKSKVTLALIDDRSLVDMKKRFGKYPWPKSAYLEIFKKLQDNGAAVIVFDSVFGDLDPETDVEAIEGMKNIGNLIMGYQSNRPSVYRIPDFYHLNLGVVITNPDPDGKFRSLTPIFQELHYSEKSGIQGIFPSMALAASLKMLDYESKASTKNYFKEWIVNIDEEQDAIDKLRGEFTSYMSISPNGETELGRRIKLDRDGKMRLRWYQVNVGCEKICEHSHASIPVHRFFDEGGLTEKEKVLIKDRIIVIGASARTLGVDLHATPASPMHLGADIHATAIDNILFEEYMTMLSDWQNLTLIVLFAIPIFYLRVKLKNMAPTFVYTLVLMVIYFLLMAVEMINGIIIDIATPEIFMVVAFAAGTFFKELDKDKEVELLEKNISKLVSKEVFLEIQKMGKAFQTSGNRMEITSVFVDLRNFTTLSENLAPVDLKDILNEFYSVTEQVTLKYRGTIDKFLGDGILIMFGIVPTENHAEDSVSAVREIIEKVQDRIKLWNKEKALEEQFGVKLDVGAAINSGNAFVGFLGTPDRLAFTAVGDTVNLSARLQDMTKIYKTRIIISEYTVKLLSDKEGLETLDKVSVRGRETPLEIFTFSDSFFEPPVTAGESGETTSSDAP